MTQRNKADSELKKLGNLLNKTFDKRRINDTGTVTEIVRDRITDASGQVLAGGKVRKVKFTASGLTDQVVNVPDGTAISVGDAIQVTRSADRTIRPDWEYRRVIRSTSALGETQDQDRHVSTPVGFSVDDSSVYTPVPGGTSFAYVELTWTENPAVEGVAHYIIGYRKDTETAWRTIADPVPPLRIEDLEVNQTYNFRIQAVNGHGVASTWSSVISYTTLGDTTQPKPVGGAEGDAVANLAADFTDENIVITWDEIDLTDNDFQHYEIELYDDSGMGTTYRQITRAANSYTYTYADNYKDTSGSPDASVYIRVRARDYTGNTNTWATVTATNAAPGAPTSLAGTWDKQDLVLTWTPPSDPDLEYFKISIWDDNTKVLKYRDYILSIGKLITDSMTYTYRVEDNVADTGNNTPDTAVYVEVVAYDKFQQSSTADTLDSSKTTPSGTVGTVSTSFDDRDLFISFVGVTDTNLDRYKIVLTGAGGSFTYYTRANVFQYSYDQNVADNGTVGDPSIGYSITWLNKHGQESSAVTGTATNAAPAEPANLSATGGFQQIVVTWDRVTDVDVIFYKLYGSTSSGFTPGAGNLLFTGRGTEFSHAVAYSETWYYRVSAVDVFEQESTIAAEANATSYAIDDQTPAAPATLTLTSDIDESTYHGPHRGVIYASWAASVGNPAALQYELRYKLSTESASEYQYKKTGQKVTSDSIHQLDPGKTYDVNVRAISRFGEESAWYNSGTDEQETIANDATAPVVGFAGHHLEKADADANFGNAAATQWRAQGFQAPVATTVRKVTLRLKKVGAPTDNLTVEIQTDTAGVPSGSVVTNGTSNTVAGTGLSTSYGWHEFSFATPPSVSASTQYHIVVKRSGANNASNYYVWYVDESSPDYDEGTFATYNGSTWAAVAGTDAIFTVSDFDVVAGTLKVSVLWTSPQDADLHRVNIYRHTSDASGSAVIVANPAAYPNQQQQYVESYDDGTATFNAGTTYYYWLKFTDLAGNISGFTHTESTAPEGVDGGDLDTTAPTLPGDETVTLTDGLTVASDGAYIGHIDVSWNAATDTANVTYEVRWKVSGASYQYVTSSTTSYRIQGLMPGATYDVNVRALDAFDNKTAWYASGVDVSQAIATDGGNPSVATGLAATAGMMKVTLTWTTPSEDDVWRILVYRNTVDVSGSATPVSILAAKKGETQQYVDQFDTGSNPFTQGTTYYYWINVSDRNGNLSGFTASVNAAPSNVGSGEGNITLQGWSHDMAFSATDLNTVGWGAGSVEIANGTTYSIGAGNTGNMVARTYIYLDTDVSTTALQTTTTLATAVGDNKILIGTAINSTTEATFQVFSGSGGILLTGADIENRSITATQIVAGTITANEIAATTITTNEIAANTIVAGNIAAGTITGTEISASAVITAGTGNNVGVLDGADGTYRIYAGHATPASAPFRVTQAGAVTATSGTIGGWTIGATSLSSGVISLDSSTPAITVDEVTIDAAGILIADTDAAGNLFRMTNVNAAGHTYYMTLDDSDVGWLLNHDGAEYAGISMDEDNETVGIHAGSVEAFKFSTPAGSTDLEVDTRGSNVFDLIISETAETIMAIYNANAQKANIGLEGFLRVNSSSYTTVADYPIQVFSGTTTEVFRVETDGDTVVTGNNPLLHTKETSSGYTAISQTAGGVRLTATTMDTTNKYTPAIMFGSTDASFTTTNPKFLAGIAGYATEAYAADTDSGMGLEFFTTDNNAGVTPTPISRMTIDNIGVVSIRESTAPAGEFLQLYQNANGSGAIVSNDNGNITGITMDGNAETIVFSVTGTTAGTVNSSQDWLFSNGAIKIGTTTAADQGYIRWTGTELQVHDGTAYREIWHAANDGAASGLDADLLDGQHGSYYRDSANFTGTNWTDLTDGGNTTLHSHTGGGFWTQSGSDLYYNTGDVGIGTTSPTFGTGTGLEVSRAGTATLRLENTTSPGAAEIYVDGVNGLTIEDITDDVIRFITAGTERLYIKSDGGVFIGDDDNNNMTIGLHIDQKTNDDEAFTIASTPDVGHGITGETETETYFTIGKQAASGGAELRAFHPGTGGINIRGMGVTENTVKGTSALAFAMIGSSLKSGTSAVALSTANANLFVVRNHTTANFIIDVEGDYHYRGGDGGSFDEHDDAHLLRAFSLATMRNTIRSQWDKFIQYNETDLVHMGILGDTIENGGLINGAQLQRLLTGAIWQQHIEIQELKETIGVLQGQLKLLTEGA